MTVTVQFEMDSLSGKKELYPGTDTFEQSVKEALECLFMFSDEDALKWLCDNIREIK
jgi:hypothetical protein